MSCQWFSENLSIPCEISISVLYSNPVVVPHRSPFLQILSPPPSILPSRPLNLDSALCPSLTFPLLPFLPSSYPVSHLCPFPSLLFPLSFPLLPLPPPHTHTDEPTSPSADLRARHVPASSVVSSGMSSAPAIVTSPASPTFTFPLTRLFSHDCSECRTTPDRLPCMQPYQNPPSTPLCGVWYHASRHATSTSMERMAYCTQDAPLFLCMS